MNLASREVAATGLFGNGGNSSLWIIIVIFFLFCGCGRGNFGGIGNNVCCGGSSSNCCRRIKGNCNGNGGMFVNSYIIWIIVILALLGNIGGNRNTNIINVNSEDDNELDETTGF